MKRYVTTSILIALLAAHFFFYPQQFSDSGRVAGQRRGARRNVKPPTARKTPRDYSRFSHATKEHQATCKTCHKTPTSNWKTVRAFPDVADFPDHEACVRCHRQQFFKGAQPVICSDCHQKTSPRDSARFAFRNPARPRQFEIEFPHDKHQDVIAQMKLLTSPETQTLRGPRQGSPAGVLDSLRAFAHAKFLHNELSQTNPGSARGQPAWGGSSLRYHNCEICHIANTKPPVAPSGGWTDGFVPAANLFKAVPEGHDACFNCHWKSQEPTKDSCEGCHKLAAPHLPTGVPERKSLRFSHAREQHFKECTACHINITKSASLKGLRPDVPITACTECHNKEGLRLDVADELAALDKDRGFKCIYCHTSDIGRLNPPSSHYLIAGRAPVKPRD